MPGTDEDRRRDLYERFLRNGVAGFLHHESVELLVSALFPNGEVRGTSACLQARFGDLRGILDAPLSELETIECVGTLGAISLHIVREVASLYLQQSIARQDILASPEALEEFWRFRIGGLPHEVFQVAFLNSRYQLLPEGVEQLARGVADRAVVYPRVVMEAALSKRAAAIVLAHNHTNGNLEPSEQDKALTRMIVLAGETLQVKILDHVIVSANGAFSFRRAGLL